MHSNYVIKVKYRNERWRAVVRLAGVRTRREMTGDDWFGEVNGSSVVPSGQSF